MTINEHSSLGRSLFRTNHYPGSDIRVNEAAMEKFEYDLKNGKGVVNRT